MKKLLKKMRWSAALVIVISITACSDNTELVELPKSPASVPDNAATLENPPAKQQQTTDKISLKVYKSRTCGCCQLWIDHAESFGFETSAHHPDNLNKLKADNGIAYRYQSCHTAISNDGYVFEGHIPASLIDRFLENPPHDALGLAVPGMPVGSPGMEMGERFEEYDVLLLNKDGSSTVYQHIGKDHFKTTHLADDINHHSGG